MYPRSAHPDGSGHGQSSLRGSGSLPYPSLHSYPHLPQFPTRLSPQQQAQAPYQTNGSPRVQGSPHGAHGFQSPILNPLPNVQSSRSPVQRMTSPAGSTQSVEPSDRKKAAEKLVHDCYSKTIDDPRAGRRVLETTYQTHIAIKEYLLFPLCPPPDHLSPAQVGSIKSRVLVVCLKHPGKPLIQKGKYNDRKHVYQIGRTWNLEELVGITKVGNNGIILSLNKDYYWRVDEGLERIWKFARYLTSAYGSFTGRYPKLTGFTLQDFRLPAQPQRKGDPSTPPTNTVSRTEVSSIGSGNSGNLNKGSGNSTPSSLDPQRLKQRNSGPSTLNPGVEAKSHPPTGPVPNTSGLDFGQLPHKQMHVIGQRNVSNDDAHSFDFKTNDTSDNFETLAYLNSELESQLSKEVPDLKFDPRRSLRSRASDSIVEFAELIPEHHTAQLIEESDSRQRHAWADMKPKPGARGMDQDSEGLNQIPRESGQVNPSVVPSEPRDDREIPVKSRDSGREKKVEPVERDTVPLSKSSNALDESMKEIADLLDNHMSNVPDDSFEFGEGEDLNAPPPLVPHDENLEELLIGEIPESHEPLKIRRSVEPAVPNPAKDPEMDELLDEIRWSPNDDTSSLVRKLALELDSLKQKTVTELVGLDFSKQSGSLSDMAVSLAEIDNLSRVFQRMEIDLKFLSGDIAEIENNSQGLQVRAINKKTLHKDLEDVLLKVSIDAEDLQSVANFNEFRRILRLELLEQKLLVICDALATLRDEEENLSSMRALREYKSSYEQVSMRFLLNFVLFIEHEFGQIIHQLTLEIALFKAKHLLREFNNLVVFSGISFFVKVVTVDEFARLNGFFTNIMLDFLDRVLEVNFKHIKTKAEEDDTSELSSTSSLKRTLTSRLSGRLGHNKSNLHVQNVKKFTSDSGLALSSGVASSAVVADPGVVIQLITEAAELILAVKFFFGAFFHHDITGLDFAEYLKEHPWKERKAAMEGPPRAEQLQTHLLNAMILAMQAVFGNFINSLFKQANPPDLLLPMVLVYVETEMASKQRVPDYEFVVYNFYQKAIDKYKSMWANFIETLVEQVKRALVISKGGVLPVVKNTIATMTIVEDSLENSTDIRETDVRQMVDSSYQKLADLLESLFLRNDPLLKNHELDDKEREHRNVATLQNVYYAMDQLGGNSPLIRKIRIRLDAVFSRVKEAYFQKQVMKNIGKLVDFVTTYEQLIKTGKAKKYNKKYMRNLLLGYTAKDISVRAHDIRRRLEKHFLVNGEIYERELVGRLWNDMEEVFADYFNRLAVILRTHFDGEVEYSLSRSELKEIFRSTANYQ